MSFHIVLGVAECVPFVKTGGLADFAGAFGEVLASKGQKVSIVLPGYSLIDKEKFGFENIEFQFTIPISDKNVTGTVMKCSISENLDVYLICNDNYFNREGLFTENGKVYEDNAERFLFFSKGILELCVKLGNVNVLHMNDWHTAIGLFYLKEFYKKTGRLQNVGSVLTIHNLGYQGMFWHYDMHLLNVGWQYFTPQHLEFHDHINYLKSGIVHADRLVTVSPSYANEIQSEEFGFGMEGILSSRREHLYGVLNGVDYKVWHPWKDKLIPQRYSKNRFNEKQINKFKLMEQFNLAFKYESPLVTMVSRFDVQKGFDLILPVFDMLMDLGINLLIVGSGDKKYGAFFKEMENKYKGSFAVFNGYSEELAHSVYAGGDIYLMPSKYEPCGLSQLYAMKYGNVPVVRNVGGLKDTVFDVSEGVHKATGFKFDYYSPYSLFETVKKADSLYVHDRDSFNKIALNGMNTKFTWTKAINKYMKIYQEVLK